CASGPEDPPAVHLRDPIADRLQTHRSEIPFAAAAHRNGARLCLTVPRHQHERDLLDLRVAALAADLLVAHIEIATQAGGPQELLDLAGVVERAVGDRQD